MGRKWSFRNYMSWPACSASMKQKWGLNVNFWIAYALSFPLSPTASHFIPSPLVSAGFPFHPYNTAVSDLPAALSLPNSHVFLSLHELGLHTASSQSPYSGTWHCPHLGPFHAPCIGKAQKWVSFILLILSTPPDSIQSNTVWWEFLFLLTQVSQVLSPVIKRIMKSPFSMKLLWTDYRAILASLAYCSVSQEYLS